MAEATSPYAGTTPVAPLARFGGDVTLVEGPSFSLSGRSGDMDRDLPHGLFVFDTRVLSYWQLELDGHHVEPLAVDVPAPFAAHFVGHGAPSEGHADADVALHRHRHIGRGMRERLVLVNHGLVPVEMQVELRCDVDFAGLFEVKEGRPRERPRRVEVVAGREMSFVRDQATGLDRVSLRAQGSPVVEDGMFRWTVQLDPGSAWETCLELSVELGGKPVPPRFTCTGGDAEAVPTVRLEQWQAKLPRLRTDHAALQAAYDQTAEDLGALRIFDPDHPDLAIVAAGAPWFMTVFGRDSLITAWMTMIADSSLAHGVLATLARFQGEDVDDRTEEEPGKILHEMRFGSTTGLALGGGDVYYGSIDATPLFVMLLGELRRWEPDDRLVDQLLPHADRALRWIEEFGDRDGDGYVEYERRSSEGLVNQGWKDSWDAIRFADGRLAEGPIALCEVQAYVYGAFIARARLAQEQGDPDGATRWAEAADRLKRRFNEDYWLEDKGWFALALDGDKRPVDALASNIGHCLWTGIIDRDRAESVAEHLVSPGMYSGFGVRTLSSTMAAFNPLSYHNGSVWPHDTALCASGLARYGFVDAAERVIAAQLDVAGRLGGRLPELFAGFGREDIAVPVPYPTSCSPQAWASAAPLLWLRTMLRLMPSAPRSTAWIHPHVPESVGLLEVRDVRVGEHRLSVRVEGDDVEIDASPGLDVVVGPPPPFGAIHA